MEQKNRVELIGYIGGIRTTDYEQRCVANFSLATTYAYTNKSGEPIVETTWHSIVFWATNDKAKAFHKSLKKGDGVSVVGRIRNAQYTKADGTMATMYEVIGSDIKVINEHLELEVRKTKESSHEQI